MLTNLNNVDWCSSHQHTKVTEVFSLLSLTFTEICSLHNRKAWKVEEKFLNWHDSFYYNKEWSLLSQSPGYSAEMKTESLHAYEFPNGSKWKELISQGLFKVEWKCCRMLCLKTFFRRRKLILLHITPKQWSC